MGFSFSFSFFFVTRTRSGRNLDVSFLLLKYSCIHRSGLTSEHSEWPGGKESSSSL